MLTLGVIIYFILNLLIIKSVYQDIKGEYLMIFFFLLFGVPMTAIVLFIITLKL